MRLLISFFILWTHLAISAQGILSEEELKEFESITVYEKDSTAGAVILFNKGTYSFVLVENKIHFRKRIHKKIKILNESGKKYATESILLKVNNKKEFEWTHNIKASTTYDYRKKFISEDEIYTKHYFGNIFEQTFIYPDVQVGSILELEYDFISPFFISIHDWYFQDEIPTLYSELTAIIPAPISYNQVLIGNKKMDFYDAAPVENCFPSNYGFLVYCKLYKYVMHDTPAFKNEDYMLSERNYYSRIDFQLIKFLDFNMKLQRFNDSWETVDKKFNKDYEIGKEINNNSFFRGKIPKNIKDIPDKLDRAKAIYYYIQEHFTWNKYYYSIFYENNVKKAFNEKTGNATEINLALINALNAEKIDASVALISTRANGLITKHNATISSFNHLLAYIKIDGQSYYLDASQKFLPFGIIPFEALNYDARIMDFKKGSYWETIHPHPDNTHSVTAQLKINQDNDIEGSVREINTGYYAAEIRSEYNDVLKDNYVRQKEASVINSEISSYQIIGEEDNEKPFTENYQLLIHTSDKEQIFFDPFLLAKIFLTNPFQLDNRNYPIDFGYPRRHTYTLVLDLADKYTIERLPESATLKLFENNANMSVNYAFSEGILQMRFDFQLHKTHFTPELYPEIKEFFDHLVRIQNNNPVILKKI